MINTQRKDLHKSDLHSKYHYLASLPYTDLLFVNGTDNNNNVCEINTMNKIGKYPGQGTFTRDQGQGKWFFSISSTGWWVPRTW